MLIQRGVQHVVVEDCHITGWGRIGGARVWGVTSDMDSGVYAENDAGHLVVQRNLIENPRGGANDWESGHPGGPQGVSLIDSRGGNVIRYNTIRSTDDHGFNDGIGGASNFSFKGSPNRDSDIYGNIISNCWDDCIESEGANMNVRIWSNYIHHTFVDIASAATSMGPIYIFRNVFGVSRVSHQDPSGGTMIKTGMNYIDNQRREGQHRARLPLHLPQHGAAAQRRDRCLQFATNCTTPSPATISSTRAGRTYPNDSGAPQNDFKNDLTGGYLGGGMVRSLFLPSERLEWYLAPTMNRIQWGKVEFTRNGKTVTITDPLVQVKNPASGRGSPSARASTTISPAPRPTSGRSSPVRRPSGSAGRWRRVSSARRGKYTDWMVDFRRIALSMPEATEGSHFGNPDFRVGGRIFATLSLESEGFGVLLFSPEQQAGMVQDAPEIFSPVPGGWGRQGSTRVRLAAVSEEILEGALRAAWQRRVAMNAPRPKAAGRPKKK